MNSLARVILSFFLGSLFIISSCSQKAPSPELAQEAQVMLVIEGMSCEAGCKRAIESKVAKMEGVESIAVDFESAEALVHYDASVTKPDEIIATIADIGGGLYAARVKE